MDTSFVCFIHWTIFFLIEKVLSRLKKKKKKKKQFYDKKQFFSNERVSEILYLTSYIFLFP